MSTAHEMTPDHEGKEKVMKSKNGKKIVNHARSTIHRKKGFEANIYYYISESLDLLERGLIQNAPTFIFTNAVNLPSPAIYIGKPEYEEKKREYAKAFADSFYEHFMELATPELKKQFESNQLLSGERKEDVKEISKAFLSYSHLLTISPLEARNLSELEHVKLLLDMRDFFYKRFTNEPETNHLIGAFPHIKYDPVKKEYKSHLHLEMSFLNFDGKKLDLHMSKERMNMILIEMEKHPYFGKFLLPTNTLAAELKNRPKTEHIKESVIAQIKDILKEEHIDVNTAHRRFIDAGMKLTPHHESTKITDILIDYQGEKISINQLNETGNKTRTLLYKYFELQELSTSSKKDIHAVMSDAKSLIVDNSHLSPNEFISKLKENGILLIPTVTAKGVIQGYNVHFTELNANVKLSTVGVKKDDLPFDSSNPEHVNFVKKLREENLHLSKADGSDKLKNTRKSDDEYTNIQSFGDRKTFYKKRKLMYEYTTIEDYMNENAGKYAIALKKNYDYSNGAFVNNRSNKVDFKVIRYEPQKALEVSFSGHTDHAATALIQMYLENGYNGIKITKQGSIEQSRKIWRAAMLKAGEDFKVEGYEPTNDDLRWLEVEKAKMVAVARETNQKAIEAFKKDKTGFDIKVVSNQWKTVFNDPYAYAFVDLIKAGLNPMLVMTPPKKYAKGKATDDDMKALYELIIRTVKVECPLLLEQAERLLATYKPEPVPVVPIEPVAPAPAPEPAAVAEQPRPVRTEADVLTEHKKEMEIERLKQEQLSKDTNPDNTVKAKN